VNKIALFVGILIAGIAPAGAQSPCSTANLVGVYSFVASGTVLATPSGPLSAFPGAFAAAGQTVYDGDGTAFGVITVSLNGTIVTSSWTASYKVNPDCTFSKTITLKIGPTIDFFISAGDNFNELRFVATDAGLAITGSAKKLRPGVDDHYGQIP
jgi:hypothetical protein